MAKLELSFPLSLFLQPAPADFSMCASGGQGSATPRRFAGSGCAWVIPDECLENLSWPVLLGSLSVAHARSSRFEASCVSFVFVGFAKLHPPLLPRILSHAVHSRDVIVIRFGLFLNAVTPRSSTCTLPCGLGFLEGQFPAV